MVSILIKNTKILSTFPWSVILLQGYLIYRDPREMCLPILSNIIVDFFFV